MRRAKIRRLQETAQLEAGVRFEENSNQVYPLAPPILITFAGVLTLDISITFFGRFGRENILTLLAPLKYNTG